MSKQQHSPLASPINLPNGSTLKNRFAKSAMSESLGTIDNRMTARLPRLYGRWAAGGTGLLITGNVMVDRRHLGEPGNVALEDDRDLALLQDWARAGTANGTQLWMQINHPGRQVIKFIDPDPVGPSAVPFRKDMQAMFATPRPLAHAEIENIIQRFANSARLAKLAGFNGAQIHGAHGYLVNQFLSPLTNQRTDQWGGSLHNRMRFPVEIYKAMRAATGPDFALSIKLNSADFQRGGFTEEESMQVAKTLADLGMDLVEVSGGTYEQPEMAGGAVRQSTREREAYFLKYAEAIRGHLPKTPLMVTGGFRSAAAMRDAVASGATDIVGLARPLVVEPDLPARILAGEDVQSKVRPISTGIRMVDEMAMMEVSWYARQLHRMGDGKDPAQQPRGFFALLAVAGEMAVGGFRTRRLRASN
ncbi:MAG: NADH:flavin oxidoreductase/NADH oxidase family protein [Gammaproteobacteria bacterium]